MKIKKRSTKTDNKKATVNRTAAKSMFDDVKDTAEFKRGYKNEIHLELSDKNFVFDNYLKIKLKNPKIKKVYERERLKTTVLARKKQNRVKVITD